MDLLWPLTFLALLVLTVATAMHRRGKLPAIPLATGLWQADG